MTTAATRYRRVSVVDLASHLRLIESALERAEMVEDGREFTLARADGQIGTLYVLRLIDDGEWRRLREWIERIKKLEG